MRKPKSVTGEQYRALAVAVRDLLHGETPFEQRFDRYLGALASFFGEPARWEIATALSAIVHPSQHVCVQPAIFRQYLKATGSRATIAARPSNTAYARLVVIARFVSSQLVGQGEAPRDLVDALDFMRIALKPAPTRAAKAPAGRKARPPSEDEDTASNDEDTVSNDDD
jgi:hypothetical protein